MAIVITGKNATDAWIGDVAYLNDNRPGVLNLITTITDPRPDQTDGHVIESLDRVLASRHRQPVRTVANTIFPTSLWRNETDRFALYERYGAIYKTIRAWQNKSSGKVNRPNSRGTYFGRLVGLPGPSDTGAGMNQVEEIIKKLNQQLVHPRPKRFAYQATVYSAANDYRVSTSFPCLSFLSFQLDKPRLHLTAVYRNHFYFERSLGNFIGLGALLSFVAEAVGLDVGELTVVACHAEIDGIGQRDTRRLLSACRDRDLPPTLATAL